MTSRSASVLSLSSSTKVVSPSSTLELKQPAAPNGILLSLCVSVKAAARASVEKKAVNKKKKYLYLKPLFLKT